MQSNENAFLNNWYRKRRQTFFVYCLQYLLNGFEGSFNFVTLWIYSNQIQPQSPYKYYIIISFVIFIPSIFLTILIGRCGDKYRCPKTIIIILNFICLIGNILYTCSSYPALPIIGYLLLGFKYPLRAIMVGEIARTYSYREIPARLTLFTNVYFLAYVTGPFIISFFEHVDFWIGGIHITFGNISGFICACLIVIVQIAVFIFSHNLSKEFCLKEVEEKEGEIVKNIIAKDTNSLKVLREIFTTYETCLLLVVSFFTAFFEAISHRYLPILVLNVLKHTIMVLNVYLTLMAISFFLLLVVINSLQITSNEAFNAGIMAYVAMVIITISIFVASIKNPSWTDFIFLSVIFISFAFYYMMEDLFLNSAMAKCVNSAIQSYAEGTRSTVRSLGSITGAVSVLLMTEFMNIYVIGAPLVLVVLITLLLLKRKGYKHPQIVL